MKLADVNAEPQSMARVVIRSVMSRLIDQVSLSLSFFLSLSHKVIIIIASRRSRWPGSLLNDSPRCNREYIAARDLSITESRKNVRTSIFRLDTTSINLIIRRLRCLRVRSKSGDSCRNRERAGRRVINGALSRMNPRDIGPDVSNKLEISRRIAATANRWAWIADASREDR